MPYCENCGAQISESAKFCTECGTPRSAVTSKEETAEAAVQTHFSETGMPETEIAEPTAAVLQPTERVQPDKPVLPVQTEQPVTLPAQDSFGHAAVLTAEPMPQPAQKADKPRKGMAVIAYLGLLVVIPLLFARKDPYARFHANQGLVLYLLTLVCNCVSELLMGTLVEISPVLAIVVHAVLGAASVLLFVLAAAGVIGAVGGKTKPLPVIGTIRFLK